jgi:hypothetical protein
MATRTTGSIGPLPRALEQARERFEAWRKTRKGGGRIPERLWKLAVRTAAKHGAYKTSLALRLDYVVLKRRLEAEQAAKALVKHEAPTFVEVRASGSSSVPECVAWVESRSGARLRLDLRGLDASQLAAFARSFAGDLQ